MRGQPRLAELDALRGLAAIAVVLFHLTTRYDTLFEQRGGLLFRLPWGHYGVQLFFAISGFVIFMTLDRTRRPLDFVVSRFSRLYPAYWAAIGLTTVIVALGGLDALRRPPWVTAVNLTMLQGYIGVPPVDGVYWTLTVELAFYATMLGLFLAGQLRNILGVLMLWVGLKWLWWAMPSLSYLVGLLLVQKHIPFFAIGICAYLVDQGRRTVRQVAPVLLFALLTTGVVDGARQFAVACVVTLVFAALIARRLSWLNRRPLMWLGAISYTLYLVHENIGFTLIDWLERRNVESNLATLAALLTLLGLAALTTRLVEKPAMNMIRDRYNRLSRKGGEVCMADGRPEA